MYSNAQYISCLLGFLLFTTQFHESVKLLEERVETETQFTGVKREKKHKARSVELQPVALLHTEI